MNWDLYDELMGSKKELVEENINLQNLVRDLYNQIDELKAENQTLSKILEGINYGC